ncbi:MAG: DUF3568 family protein [Verrucomicrobia bacterium]|nr:DUF3568 family protein [Verrucomicrobiota bacterium]
MKTKLILVGLCCATGLFSGCVSTLDGRHEAGVPFVRDTVESRYERSFDQVYKAAKDTLTFNGILTVENVVNSTLEAKVNTRTVWMAVEKVTPTVTRVAMQVRTKAGGTDKELAHDLDKQIAIRLAGGNAMPATAPKAPTAPTTR